MTIMQDSNIKISPDSKQTPQMQNTIRSLCLSLLLAILTPLCIYAKAFSPLLLSEFPYSTLSAPHSKDIQTWLVSEKLDGVRGLWDGERMYFRSGKPMDLPPEFTQNFPPFALDGELYSPDLHFSQIISILKNPKKSKKILNLKFFVFDVPNITQHNPRQGLLKRLETLRIYLKSHPSNFIRIIPQIPINNPASIKQRLHIVTQSGGEGLVLRSLGTPYQAGRSKKDFKLKMTQDDECKIVGYTEGKGKYAHKVGAFICQYNEIKIKIGGGLSNELRQNPPPIGTIITFKYQGLTHNNIPRFPRFWRVRDEYAGIASFE